MLRAIVSEGNEEPVRFSPAFRVVPIDPDLLILISDQKRRILRAPLLYDLSLLINGKRSVSELLQTLSRSYSEEEVERAIQYLRSQNYIVAANSGADAESIFWSNVEYGDQHQKPPVSIKSLTNVPIEALIRSLESAGFEMGESCALTIVVTDSYLNPDLQGINLEQLRSGLPWILLKPAGIEGLLGPLFIPHESPCWECLAHRLRQHQVFETALSMDHPAPLGYLSSTLHTVYSLLTTELSKHFHSNASIFSSPCILSVNHAAVSTMRHRIIRRTHCKICNIVPEGISDPTSDLYLNKLRTTEEQVHEDKLLDRFAHHISPLTGIVRDLEKVEFPGDHDGLYLYSSGLNIARSHSLKRLLSHAPSNYSQGKGVTRDQAKVSALFEAIERYCVVFDGTEQAVRADFNALGQAAIHPNECMLFSKDQFEDHKSSFDPLFEASTDCPETFPLDESILWTRGRSLIDDEERLIPTALCYMDIPHKEGARYCRVDSNGVAAGCSLLDAVSRAFLELVERDAVGIWWYNRIMRECFDIGCAKDEHWRKIANIFALRRRTLWLCDVTSDLGFPVWVAISSDLRGDDLWFGSGCHFDAECAITKALSEVCQRLPIDRKTDHWTAQGRSLQSLPFLKHGCPKPLDISMFRSTVDGTELESCREAVARAGLDLIAVDMTRQDIGLPVARVIVPGLRHLRPRYAPGRLYDVPVKMKWLPEARKRDELSRNSILPRS
jgi:ribosomal protein S12 methylthiotransferase accessory factor